MLQNGVQKDYFPYGDEIGTATAGNVDKFGTYHRDQTTGLDYADQRYFAGLSGRFLTSDPYEASGGASAPGSWNRYPYVGGDPVNFSDPKGLLSCWNGGSIQYGSGPTYTSMVCQGDYGEPIVGVKEYDPSSLSANELMVRVQEDLAHLDSPGGLRNFRVALRIVANTDFSKCQKELERITGQGMASIREQARTSAAFVFDGTTSPVIWHTGSLGPSSAPVNTTLWTIANEFAASPGIQGLSQGNGAAVYLRPGFFEAPNTVSEMIAYAAGSWSVGLTGGITNYGYASALHEVLHKFGLTDAQLFEALGVSANDVFTYGSASISVALRSLCW